MPTRDINLTDHFDQFVGSEIKAGRYRNASEVMRAGLRLLEQQSREDRENSPYYGLWHLKHSRS